MCDDLVVVSVTGYDGLRQRAAAVCAHPLLNSLTADIIPVWAGQTNMIEIT